ncbi:MAG TPA: hypothetical protein VG755_44615 [Nannocystaceae bacterium]|nr:hypothetical protein [Nannocystaceae bacterium]
MSWRCSVVLALAACTVQRREPTASPTAEIRVGPGTYEVGHTMVLEQRETFEMATTSMGAQRGGPKLASASVRRWREEVLAVSDGRPSRLRMSWEQDDRLIDRDGVQERELGPAHGVYIVERAAGTTSVRREDEATITTEEHDAIAGVLDHPGYVNQLERRLANQRLSPGWAMDVDTSEHDDRNPPDALTRLVVHLVFGGTRVASGHTQALFVASSQQAGPYGLGEIAATSTGTAVIDVEHGWLSSIEYGGPMHMEGTAGERGVTQSYAADGRWSFALTIDHG